MKNITATIKKIIAEKGISIIDQERRLIAILADLHPEERRNRYLIELSLRGGIPQKIHSLINVKLANNDPKVNSLKHFFKEEFFLEEGAVKLVFDCWIEALKLDEKSYIENVNGVSLKMIAIKGGTFLMGSNEYYDEKPIHTVTVRDFYMAETQVTQAQWKAVMGSNPSDFKGDNLPVECESWDDVQDYIRELNAKTGKIFRLPTEAEWEYAAGGGENNRTIYAGTNSENSLCNYAWYSDNSGNSTHPVGTKQPNQFGLYDMSGNVWEWCSDLYGQNYYANSQQNNPKGASSGSTRVLRGGSWDGSAPSCRVSFRDDGNAGHRGYYYGFRLVRSF